MNFFILDFKWRKVCVLLLASFLVIDSSYFLAASVPKGRK